ncbi:MAG: universal stress protein [Halobacteriota archaeon]
MYRVLIAVDSEMDDPERIAEAVASLPDAEASVDVTVLNVFEAFEVTGAESGKVSSEDMYDAEALPDAVRTVRDRLANDGIEATTVRRHGDVSEEILEEAADLDADLVVLGGRKRSPVGKALFGSITQTVLLDADRPVMVVRTE